MNKLWCREGSQSVAEIGILFEWDAKTSSRTG